MVEKKVQASTAASAVAGLVLWILGRYVFKGSAVPDVLQSWIYTLAPAVVTFAAGYMARHTSRSLPVAALRPVASSGTVTVVPAPEAPPAPQAGP